MLSILVRISICFLSLEHFRCWGKCQKQRIWKEYLKYFSEKKSTDFFKPGIKNLPSPLFLIVENEYAIIFL